MTVGGMHALADRDAARRRAWRRNHRSLARLAEFRRGHRACRRALRQRSNDRRRALEPRYRSPRRRDHARRRGRSSSIRRPIRPASPRRWTSSIALLDLARRRGLWIIADEIYGRLVYQGDRAPSFHDVMAPDDRILFVQTLSKNWAMTGWRIGWLEAPPALGPIIENVVQYTTSGVPVFIQRAADRRRSRKAKPFIAEQIARMRQCRDIFCDGLADDRTRALRPAGGRLLSVLLDRWRCGYAYARLPPCRRSRARRRAGLGLRARRRGLCPALLRPLARTDRRGDAAIDTMAGSPDRLFSRSFQRRRYSAAMATWRAADRSSAMSRASAATSSSISASS